MQETLLHFQATDGYRFYARRYLPVGTPLARLVFLHGIRSHGGWYEQSCRRFADAGYEVHFLDRRGSGLNTAHRGDTPSFRRLISDVTEYLFHVRERHAWLPTCLAGISWGGKLALGVAIQKPKLVAGVALLCPGLVPKIQPPLLRRFRFLLARVLRPTNRFPIPLNEPDLFTADPKRQKFIAENPHDLHEATARFFVESFLFDLYLKRNAHRVKCPVLLMLAEHDRILNNACTRAYMAKLKNASSITICDYPNTHHTLEFEAPDHPWGRDLATWLRDRL